MKTTYSTPEIDILIIQSPQVITTSGDALPDDDKLVELPFDQFH